MKLREFLIHCMRADGIGPVTAHKVMAQLGVVDYTPAQGNREHPEILSWSPATLGERCGLSLAQANALHTVLRDADAYRAQCLQLQCAVLTLFDAAYPVLLRTITVPPPVLWCQGTLLPPVYRACAVVGSRAATTYACDAVDMLIPPLAAAGVVMVSGGARGVDARVHKQTLQHNGCTVLVAGSGLLHTYPAEHKPLFKQIIAAGGLIISPFPPDVGPSKGTFPARNRIIAALAQVTLVVQAAARSGALITAQHALEEGRDVAAVPGPIVGPEYVGSNELLRTGAHVVYAAEHLAALLPGDVTLKPEPVKAPEHPLISFLATPRTLEEIITHLALEYGQVQELLFDLQLAGHIRQNHAGLWERP